MMTLTDQAKARCLSWIKHSGLDEAEIARRAGIAPGTLHRFKTGGGVTVRALRAIETTIPKNWRDPLPGSSGEAA